MKKKSKFIPVCEPLLAGNELKYVTDCVRNGWISSRGEFVRLFEQGFSRYCGAKYGVACSSGTAALHLALAALGIKKNDEVIIPAFTMISTAASVLYVGAKPILVDVKKDSFCIDPSKIEEKITKKTKAIIAVHVYGHPADMDSILKIAKKHNLFVVEDAAEAHGAEYRGKKVGSIGDVGCFSFYANKIVTTGEGGMLVTKSKLLRDRCLGLRDLSRENLLGGLGFNYRLSNIQAAIGLAQLERIDELLKARKVVSQIYSKYLTGIPGLILPYEAKDVIKTHWMHTIIIEDNFVISRDALIRKLFKEGIETRPFFSPISRYSFYKRKKGESYLVSDWIADRGLYLPSSPKIKKEDIEFIAEVIKKAKR